jgi:hypothetical protein
VYTFQFRREEHPMPVRHRGREGPVAAAWAQTAAVALLPLSLWRER